MQNDSVDHFLKITRMALCHCVLVATIPRVNTKMTHKPYKYCVSALKLSIIFALVGKQYFLPKQITSDIYHCSQWIWCRLASQLMKQDWFSSLLTINLNHDLEKGCDFRSRVPEDNYCLSLLDWAHFWYFLRINIHLKIIHL